MRKTVIPKYAVVTLEGDGFTLCFDPITSIREAREIAQLHADTWREEFVVIVELKIREIPVARKE